MTTARRPADGTVGIGILGTGGIVRRSFVPAVKATPGARLIGVLSRDRQRARAFADQVGIPEAYDDLAALLGNPDVHAVIIATPDALHEPQAIAAAEAGVIFAMGYSLRFLNHIRMIRDLARGGRVGRVRYARALWTSKTAASQETWRTDPAQARHDPFREEIEDFVRAIRTGGPPSAGLDDGLLNVRILERALVT